MANTCDICGKGFKKLSLLYMHKQSHKPSLVLHQHPHPAFGMDANQIVPKRKREDDEIPSAKKFHEENDPGLKVVDSYDRDKDDEYDSGLEVRDEYDRNKEKRKRAKQKKIRNQKRKFIKPSSEDEKDVDLETVDSYDEDEERDPGLIVTDKYKYNYRKEYKKCEEEKEDLLKEIKKLKKYFSDEIEEVKDKCKDELHEKDRKYKTQIENLKEEYADDKREKERIYRIKIDEKEEAHEDAINKLKQDAKAMEEDCKQTIDLLNKQLKSEQEENNLSPLADAIFNCTSIEEIFEIKNLIESHRIGELKDKHYKTLQHMFLSLSYGILPICQPQRDTITESQRKIIDQIQTSSFTTAKGIVKQNQKEIANLFSIIEDSLKLARNSFNRYGGRA